MNFIISNNSEVPIYQQIKKEIINSISNNELKENDMLPSIRNLAKDLRISILTVKKAYDELEQEAYIKTVQGKGTFVGVRGWKGGKGRDLPTGADPGMSGGACHYPGCGRAVYAGCSPVSGHPDSPDFVSLYHSTGHTEAAGTQ